jgi:DNA-binding beta-propeller fold protein YncE
VAFVGHLGGSSVWERAIPRRLLCFVLAGVFVGVLVAAAPAFGANQVYWTQLNETISFANLDGTGGVGQLDTTGATVSHPGGTAIDAATNKIYWANALAGISFANLDGTGGGGQLDTSGATVSGAEGVAIDPATNKIYWAIGHDDARRVGLDLRPGA